MSRKYFSFKYLNMLLSLSLSICIYTYIHIHIHIYCNKLFRHRVWAPKLVYQLLNPSGYVYVLQPFKVGKFRTWVKYGCATLNLKQYCKMLT